MPNRLELTSQKFGRLTVLKFAYMKKGKSYWNCFCKCGNEKIISSNCLKNGHTKSCGCLNIDNITERNKIHSLSKTRFYHIWCGIKERCLNKNKKAYKNYGERGIKICDGWLNFINFRDDMYESYLEHIKNFGTKHTTIDRKDNEGNYEKNNCKWSTRTEQAINKRNNIFLTHNDITLTLTEWARKLNLNKNTLRSRLLESNWSTEKALTTPTIKPAKQLLTFNGQTMELAKWAKKFNMNQNTLFSRIYRSNLSTERALTTPVKTKS